MNNGIKTLATRVAMSVGIFVIAFGFVKAITKIAHKRKTEDPYLDVDEEGDWKDPDIEAELGEE